MSVVDIAKGTFIIAVGITIGLLGATAFGYFSFFLVHAMLFGL